jgi:hypothetical protein
MAIELINLLFHPDSFFTRKIQENQGFFMPLLIVCSGGVIALLTPFIPLAFSAGGGAIHNFIILPSTVAWYLITPFIAWVLLSVGLFGLCRFLSGTGTFPATLQNAGYGMLPLTLNAILGLIMSLLPVIYLKMTLLPFLLVNLTLVALSFILIIWSGYLWMYAMEKTHVIPHGSAMVAAGVVAGIYILWTFTGLANGLMLLFAFQH